MSTPRGLKRLKSKAAILVIEKDPAICDLLVDLFATELAADVTCAKRAEDALEQIRTGAFGLALIDVGMPQISGFELATHAVTNNIPVLLYSGHPDALRKLQEHDFAYLAKPFAIEDLVDEAVRIISFPTENIADTKISIGRLQAL